jgi:2,3-bisphosphoglycerate-independent phosphoglycerate mutase
MNKKTLVLVILDGWGYSEATESNAIYQANKPTWDHLWNTYPHTLISGCGRDVGLPEGQMGNSEVGHLTIGAGRIVNQDLTRINLSIQNQDFFTNPVLLDACKQAKQHNSNLHIIGLLSPGGVHSHEEQIFAAINLAKQQHVDSIVVHAILDGRDTPPISAASSLEKLDQITATSSNVKIGSVCGRFYAMDRDNRNERTRAYHNLLLNKNVQFSYPTAISALKAAYGRKETDEFAQPSLITSTPIVQNDVVVLMNFRSDRARQICRVLTDESLTPKLAKFVTLTEYAKDLRADVAFPKEKLHNVIGEYLQNNGLSQLRIAETEKYAHVTFFLNGGQESKFAHEDRILIPSPNIATYDLCPEMSAYTITDELVTTILSDKYDVIFCNYANADMVGHTGNLPATIRAIETLDTCLKQVIDAIIKIDGIMLITADHGNAEKMLNPITKQPCTSHTTNLIPLIYVDKNNYKNISLKTFGSLQDLAPTILQLLNLSKPLEMTGKSLIEINTK